MTNEAPSPLPSRHAAKRRTVIVAEPLALRVKRLAAARGRQLGTDVTTLPLMAARLAGGFARTAVAEDVLPAIVAALAEGGLDGLRGIAGLLGTPRAVARTLSDLWRSGGDIRSVAASPRAAGLALIDARVRAALPPGVLVPPDLRDAALSRLQHAPAVLGAVALDELLEVEPVWRPMLAAMCRMLPVSWQARGDLDRRWFPGNVGVLPAATPEIVAADACADPRSEVVEALRWARALLASGGVAASEVAIARCSRKRRIVWRPLRRRFNGGGLRRTIRTGVATFRLPYPIRTPSPPPRSQAGCRLRGAVIHKLIEGS